MCFKPTWSSVLQDDTVLPGSAGETLLTEKKSAMRRTELDIMVTEEGKLNIASAVGQ